MKIVRSMGVFIAVSLHCTSICLIAAAQTPNSGCTGSNVVTSCNEMELREAISRGGTVLLCCNGTISLTSTLHITNDVVLDAETRAVTISGNDSVRLFRVATNITFELRNLTLANGRHIGTNGADAGPVAGQPAQPGEDGAGGAIYNQGGTVRLFSCVLSNNSALGGRDGVYNAQNPIPGAVGAGKGGAVFSENGQVAFQNVLAVGNSAMGALRRSGLNQEANGPTLGGALSAVGGAVYIASSTFVSNVATGRVSAITTSFSAPVKGGAIHLQDASAIVQGGIFSGNLAVAESVGTQMMQSAGSVYGGALFSASSTVIVSESSLSMNKALAGDASRTFGGLSGEAQGGAIYNDGVLNLFDTSVSGNQALSGGYSTGNRPGRGGGLYNGGTAHVNRSTFDGNIAKGGQGGVRFNPTTGGDGLGGGIANLGTLNSTNCTLVLNRAQAGGTLMQGTLPIASGGTAAGGGIQSAAGTLRLINVTLASNVVIQGVHSLSPGGANVANNGDAILSANTLVAFGLLSTNDVSTLHSNVSGTITDSGFNLSSDNSWAFTSGTSSGNTDPRLAPLDDYGGATRTMALLAGSPAIDAATGPDCPPTDQRGFSRPSGPACDIGAFESAPTYSVRGRISGFRVPAGMQVNAGPGSGITDSNLTYHIFGLAAGAYTVVPSPLTHVIVPATRNVSVGPDMINVDFTAYRRNSISPQLAVNTVRLVYAGTNGAVVRIQASNDLMSWTDYATNTVGSDGLFEVVIQNNGAAGRRYFRAIQP